MRQRAFGLHCSNFDKLKFRLGRQQGRDFRKLLYPHHLVSFPFQCPVCVLFVTASSLFSENTVVDESHKSETQDSRVLNFLYLSLPNYSIVGRRGLLYIIF